MRGSGLVALSLALAVVGSLFWLFFPAVAYEEASSPAETGGSSAVEIVPVEQGRTTLLEDEGPGILVVLALPIAVVLAALALERTRARRATRTTAAVLLAGFCVAALMSIGLVYVPSALAMIAAAALAFTHPARQ